MRHGTGSLRRPATLSRVRDWLARRGLPIETQTLTALVSLTLVIVVGILVVPTYVPLATLVVPLVMADTVLSPRRLPAFVLFVMVASLAVVQFRSLRSDVEY